MDGILITDLPMIALALAGVGVFLAPIVWMTVRREQAQQFETRYGSIFGYWAGMIFAAAAIIHAVDQAWLGAACYLIGAIVFPFLAFRRRIADR
jgi:hypothetical protein